MTTIYAPTVKTTATSAKDAYAKVQAYRQLFNIVHNDILTHVRGIFRDKSNELIFLTQQRALVTIDQHFIKWYDAEIQRNIIIVSSDATFELSIRV